jgi:ectoine hydroxylase-related dioxygenase (phytanoyl-CoA dioxygenase family)
MVRRPDIVAFVEGLFGRLLEIQHSKLNCKPLNDSGEGRIAWHQDYPFFPHTNYDLVAVGIHLDDEGPDEGPVLVVPGSHRAGPLSHVRPDGEFGYEVTEALPDDAGERAVTLTGPAGQVTVHHCLTLHTSEPKRSANLRRILITQYRARDAVQLAGVMWEEAGVTVGDEDDGPRTARFTDGTVVDLRGRGGRLYDRYGKLAPDRDG